MWLENVMGLIPRRCPAQSKALHFLDLSFPLVCKVEAQGWVVLLVSARPAFKSFDDVLLLPKLYRVNLASGTSLMTLLPHCGWGGLTTSYSFLRGSGRLVTCPRPQSTASGTEALLFQPHNLGLDSSSPKLSTLGTEGKVGRGHPPRWEGGLVSAENLALSLSSLKEEVL